jgi:hypothetical protein
MAKYKFGKTSKKNLNEAHPLLQEIFNEVIQIFNCSVIEGHRTEAEQNKAYERKQSKLKYPKSKHNKVPSLAVDVIPYPVDWKDTNRFCLLAGVVKGIAHSKDIKIRWGGDWNGNNYCTDEHFLDMPHFELVGVRK